MGFTLKEFTRNYDFKSLPGNVQSNLEVLLERMNNLAKAYGHPMYVTSGYRSLADHLRIYKDKGITDKAHIPMQSRHLYGAAVDISDPDGELYKWVHANVPLLESIGLWCEEDPATPRIHFQISPPSSGSRFFKP